LCNLWFVSGVFTRSSETNKAGEEGPVKKIGDKGSRGGTTLVFGNVEVFQGEDAKWYWHMIAKNGEVLSVSQAYKTKWSAKRTAKKIDPNYRMA
jgi:uncharacterized protein YegP (UPF0339 family)